MRASRLLSLLLLLQSRGKMTATELAAELEVSVRTVHRDIEALAGSGVPIYADRGVTGGFQLLAGYSTRLTGLTEDEARSLVFAGVPGAATELGLGEVLAAAQMKLDAAMPVGLRTRADELRSRFLLDQRAWFRAAEQVPLLLPVAAAVWEQRRIRARYQRWGGDVVTRTLRPLGVVNKAGVWYLVAMARSDEPRMYRVSRIRRCDTLEPFERPKFDLAAYWNRRDEELRAALYRETAVVRLSRNGRRYLYLLSSIPLSDDDVIELQADENDWVTVRLPVESLQHATKQFLQLGTDCEVLEPAELRDAIIREISGLNRLYSR